MTALAVGQVQEVIHRLCQQWIPERTVLEISQLTPDASLRRYFRVTLAPVGSVTTAGTTSAEGVLPEQIISFVAMFFDSVASPEASGGNSVDADDAYVELSRFFSRNGVAVPALLLDSRENALLFIEDLGDVNLASCIINRDPRVDALLDGSLDEIHELQAISPDDTCLAFRRSFSAEQYAREMSEFDDFILAARNVSPEIRADFRFRALQLARRLDEEPRVLVHRDFHAWNLLVHEDRVRVIDFQDALLATRAYDLVSLLNDRDMDSLLGIPRYVRLVQRFAHRAPNPVQFFEQYDRVLLQRDLKVAGRFAKLSQLRGLTQYEQWIPGTLRRIGRTLERIAHTADGASPQPWGAGLGDLLCPVLGELEEGRRTPLRLDQ